MDGTHTGKWSAESVRGRKAECAVQRSILSPGGYQGEGISVARMRAEMGSPWSVAQRDTLNVRSPAGAGCFCGFAPRAKTCYNGPGRSQHLTGGAVPCKERSMP